MRGTGVPWNRWSKRVSLGAQRQTVKETRVSWHVPAGRGGTGDLSVNAREKIKERLGSSSGPKVSGGQSTQEQRGSHSQERDWVCRGNATAPLPEDKDLSFKGGGRQRAQKPP